jgi:hypothetical protein
MGTSGQWAPSASKSSNKYFSNRIGRAVPSTQTKRTCMKKTIKQRFVSWLLKSNDEAEYDSMPQDERNDIDLEGSVRFDLMSATGGRILQVRRWDRKRDDHEMVTYVIPSGEDVGQRVAKILNLELIK